MGRIALVVLLICASAGPVDGSEHDDRVNYVELDVLENILAATVHDDFAGNTKAYSAAIEWQERKIGEGKAQAPHVACAEYGRGREAHLRLKQFLSTQSVVPISHSENHGACFVVTATSKEAASMREEPGELALSKISPFLTPFKIAPTLLDHGSWDQERPAPRLQTKYGLATEHDRPRGLTLRMSPGVLPTGDPRASVFVNDWIADLMEESLNLYDASFWTDPELSRRVNGHPANHPGGAAQVLEWTRAAEVVHRVASKRDEPPGEVCAWGRIAMRQTDDDVLLVEGVTHLLPTNGTKVPEVKMACYMGLISQLASKPEVLRVAPLHSAKKLNAVASAVIESGTDRHTPLRDVGLDGTGEVIQVVDTGLDDTSCLFADEEKGPTERGYLFKGFRQEARGNFITAGTPLTIPFDLSRRKVVQYTELFKSREDGEGGSESSSDDLIYFSDCLFCPTYGLSWYSYSYWNDSSSWYSDDSWAYTDNDTLSGGYDYYYYYYYSSSEPSFCRDHPYDSSSYWSYYYGDNDTSYFSYSTSGGYYNVSSSSPWPSYKSSSYYPWSSYNYSGYYSWYNSSSYYSWYNYYGSSWKDDFSKDYKDGHGTHTSGIAAGAVPPGSPLLDQSCSGDEVPSCAGGCMPDYLLDMDSDPYDFEIDLYCPAHDCAGYGAESESCLGDDASENLIDNGGVARGAKLSFLDISYDQILVPEYAGNSLWSASFDSGAKIHSNSWGEFTQCELTELDHMYDSFMYENPEHLLLFAAGNDGGYKDIPNVEFCTVGSPALGKNILTVGASSNGPSRVPLTHADGRLSYEQLGFTNYEPDGYPWICFEPSLGMPTTTEAFSDIDTMAFFSSYGPTSDMRIKPEVVAPGDQVFSARSDGTTDESCKLYQMAGTSMATPAVAGAAALVRQYFTDPNFYALDTKQRGLCPRNTEGLAGAARRFRDGLRSKGRGFDNSDHGSEQSRQGGNKSIWKGRFSCGAFAPSAATVKAMLINSANLMGGTKEPDRYRGFGRVHLEAGMPLYGEGYLGLLVVDSLYTSIRENSEVTYTIWVDADAGLELRATLSWIDPPASSVSAKLLFNDLDLSLTAPDGTKYTMWGSGIQDMSNVNERVIVPAVPEGGSWNVTVSSKAFLAADTQAYSLVVTGAVSVDDDDTS